MNSQATTSSKVKCLPCYLLIDTSSSMKDSQGFLNEALESLYDELIVSPRISEFAHISIISFNTNAYVVLPMTDIQEVTALPQLECNGLTDLTKAFVQLRACIDKDVPALVQAGREVLRPVAFLLTDGMPTGPDGKLTEEWRTEYARLIDPGWRRHPNIVTFGFGKAQARTLSDMATKQGAAFLAKNLKEEKEALRRIFVTLLNTLVSSARENALNIPTEVDGFIRVSDELVD